MMRPSKSQSIKNKIDFDDANFTPNLSDREITTLRNILQIQRKTKIASSAKHGFTFCM